MRIDVIMARPVQFCRPDDTLADAAKLMWDHDCGCLPVLSSDGSAHVAGIITDRDICMHALFQAKPLQELRASDAMSAQVHVCHPEESLAHAETTMRKAKVRRLPVVDERGLLVGMISLADLAQEAARRSPVESQAITETEVGDTFAAISEPLHRQLAA